MSYFLKKMNMSDIKIWLFFTVMTALLFLPMSNYHLGLDSYVVSQLSFAEHGAIYLASGRLMMYAYLFICDMLKLSFGQITLLSWIVAVVSLATAIFVVSKELKKRAISTYLAAMLATSYVLTPFLIEFFFYPEYTGIQALGILLAILAATRLGHVFDATTAKKSNLILTVILGLLSITSYQPSFAFFGITFCMLQWKKTNYLKRYLTLGLIYGFLGVLLLIIIKLSGGQRVADVSDLSLFIKAKVILESTLQILSNYYGLFAAHIYNIILTLSLLSLLILSVCYQKTRALIQNILIILAVFAFTLFPHILTKSIWLVPRSIVTLSTMNAVVFILIAFSITKIKENTTKYFKAILVVFICLGFLVQVKSWRVFMVDRYKVNVLDSLELKTIQQKIQKYEQNEQKNVEYLRFYNDATVRVDHEAIKVVGDANIRVGGIGWSRGPAIEAIVQRKLSEGPENIEVSHYCGAQNWDFFDSEQIIIMDRTLYICVY